MHGKIYTLIGGFISIIVAFVRRNIVKGGEKVLQYVTISFIARHPDTELIVVGG